MLECVAGASVGLLCGIGVWVHERITEEFSPSSYAVSSLCWVVAMLIALVLGSRVIPPASLPSDLLLCRLLYLAISFVTFISVLGLLHKRYPLKTALFR